MGRSLSQQDWDLFVNPLVHAINIQVFIIHGFTPAELLLGYNPSRTGREVGSDTEWSVAVLSMGIDQGRDIWDKEEELVQRQVERLGSMLEARWEGPYILGDLAWHGKSGPLYDINTQELVQVKKCGLKDRVLLNDVKRDLTRPTVTEDVDLVDLLEYDREEHWVREGEVDILGGGASSPCKGSGTHVDWYSEAQGVG
ncbi:hypothetical protein HOY80DRAFT_1029998 [Tuber brumale]|nr:hypothetical protein HOY80DRAFT_1029998 [Tuber brumale]